ncbi:insulinase family protein [Anaerolineales bacterium HSG25]|nr:insulinase family protein [Anaerolineales bacterium HSG25]
MTKSFELIKETTIPELNIEAQLYRHVKTGAQLLSVINDDENKSFGITFRTPPADATGVAHIMEHSVLCGSRKYPLKEPFIELAKGSLNTYLNAFTYPDKTCYPVASQNLQDFYNLIDVYLDSVFHPNISPETLQQEGWHYELTDKDEPLIYKGVVFNEMKGAYSAPERLMYNYSKAALLPDTPYGVDSGGDPQAIPDLTYEKFKSFFDTCYHPSNALIYFYGDDDPTKRFEILETYLADFEAKDVSDTAIPLQQPFVEPKEVVRPYAANEEDTEATKSMVTLNWLLPENNNPQLSLALSILSHAVLRTNASPLRKALVDSGLGEDVMGGGSSGTYRQLTFSTGMKGVKRADVPQVEQLILDTLAQIAEQGIEPDMLEAAMNTIEFRMREYNTGGFPRGLAIMLSALTTWLHGQDPLEQITFEGPLAAVKQALQDNPRYLEELINEHLLTNSHRVTMILEPDAQIKQQIEAKEVATLAQVKADLSPDELEAVIESTKQLQLAQETPDSAEALAMIPSLKLSDIDQENKSLPIELFPQNGYELLHHNLFTSGIVYLEVGFNFHGIPQELLPYFPLFSDALFDIGTETEDYTKLSQRIGRKTGGVQSIEFISNQKESPESLTWLFLRGKGTVAQVDDMLAIMRDVLLTVKLDNQERFRQMVLEEKAHRESIVVPGGHSFVSTRIRARFTEAGWLSEQTGGVSYLFFLRRLVDEVENDWPGVVAKLERIRQIVVNRNAAVCNITIDADNWQQIKPKLTDFMDSLPAQPYQPAEWDRSEFPIVAAEGLTAAGAQINYVGKAANLYDLGYQFHGSMSVINNYLQTTYLWEKIRMQGGAYGAFCSFDKNAGVFGYLSYRDPNLLETLTNYDQANQFLRQLNLNDDQLTKSIIGVIGSVDTYRLPDAKGYMSMIRHLLNYSEADHQQYREEILGTTIEHFHALAEVLAEVNKVGLVSMLGSAEAIEAVNESQGGDWLTITKVR